MEHTNKKAKITVEQVDDTRSVVSYPAKEEGRTIFECKDNGVTTAIFDVPKGCSAGILSKKGALEHKREFARNRILNQERKLKENNDSKYVVIRFVDFNKIFFFGHLPLNSISRIKKFLEETIQTEIRVEQVNPNVCDANANEDVCVYFYRYLKYVNGESKTILVRPGQNELEWKEQAYQNLKKLFERRHEMGLKSPREEVSSLTPELYPMPVPDPKESIQEFEKYASVTQNYELCSEVVKYGRLNFELLKMVEEEDPEYEEGNEIALKENVCKKLIKIGIKISEDGRIL